MKLSASLAIAVALVAGCGGAEPRPPADAFLGSIERAAGGVRSLRLTDHVSRRVRAICAEAARGTGIHVVCPPIVPADGVTDYPAMAGPQDLGRNVYTMSFNNGQVPGHVHWEIGAGTLEDVSLTEFDTSDWAASGPVRPARLVGARRCAGFLILIYRFPESDGQLEGHDAALATAGRITYFASVHGYRHDDADVAMLLAILLSIRSDDVARIGPALGACHAVVGE